MENLPSCPSVTPVPCNCCDTCATPSSTYYCSGDVSTCLSACLNACIAEENSFATFPVEFTFFEALKENESTVLLKWETATETNNSHFLVQRSSNGLSFETIGQLAGAGTSSSKNYYRFTDQNPLPSTSYYRLKQIDFDESYDFSKVVAIELFEAEFHFNVSPTIINEYVNIHIQLEKPTPLTIKLIGANGHVYQTQKLYASQGKQIKNLEAGKITDGLYIVQIIDHSTGKLHHTKVIKLKK